MINAVLVFNGQGQPRLTKFYTQLDTSIQQRLISEIFTLVSNRPSGACNFLPLPPLLAAASSSSSSSSSASSSSEGDQHNDVPSLVTYRNYATLYFIVISTATESPLALLDLIQVYVESLDKLFENVCELDLIFNFETLHAALSEMIVGGVVIETNLDRIVSGVKSQGTVAKRPVNESRASGLGAGLGMGGNFVWPGR
ncbi:AP complex, mu/sigma subunit [Xylariomycetidae sp. FL0641]|nr:AP complex, mu/sigma subunit [Xylariomycetidae sp. FL0641]